MSSSFGTLFRTTTFGESHCRGVGAIVDGCPPGLALDEEDLGVIVAAIEKTGAGSGPAAPPED